MKVFPVYLQLFLWIFGSTTAYFLQSKPSQPDFNLECDQYHGVYGLEISSSLQKLDKSFTDFQIGIYCRKFIENSKTDTVCI